jgi:hypothetical protein
MRLSAEEIPMAMKADWVAFVQSLKTEIAVIRRDHLEPLESGKLRIHAGHVDITKSEAASLRGNIASIEAVIAAVVVEHPDEFSTPV